MALYRDAGVRHRGHGHALDVPTAWGGALAYTFQLYFDFSGYSDMAIGLARMFGIQLPLNFNSPYRATIDHRFLAALAHHASTLPARLPLHPARRKPRAAAAPLRQSDGHDAAVRPVARRSVDLRGLGRLARACSLRRTGFGYACSSSEQRRGRLWWRSCAWALTFAFVVVTWVFFRAKDLDTAMSMLQSMFSPSSFGSTT